MAGSHVNENAPLPGAGKGKGEGTLHVAHARDSPFPFPFLGSPTQAKNRAGGRSVLRSCYLARQTALLLVLQGKSSGNEVALNSLNKLLLQLSVFKTMPLVCGHVEIEGISG